MFINCDTQIADVLTANCFLPRAAKIRGLPCERSARCERPCDARRPPDSALPLGRTRPNPVEPAHEPSHPRSPEISCSPRCIPAASGRTRYIAIPSDRVLLTDWE